MNEAKRRTINRFGGYKPNIKQLAFHSAGAGVRERVLLAGNQLGKTVSAGFETAMHLTGSYPSWWRGKRFEEPVTGWAASVTGEATRDNPQRVLLGSEGAAAGAIPAELVVKTVRATGGAAGALDSVLVRHRSGGCSSLQFKSYAQGREKWQGPTLDFVWFDEEPPLDIYMEGLTRTNATAGICYLTFTPLLGRSAVLGRFWSWERSQNKDDDDRALIRMTLADATHYSEAQRQRVLNSYSEDERRTRVEGLPATGEGRVFAATKSAIGFDGSTLPSDPSWVWIAGMDFGWDHPTAAVLIGWDREADQAFVTRSYRQARRSAEEHARELRGWGTDLWWSWPQDGLQTEKGSGRSLRDYYQELGLKMLPEPARFRDGGNSVEVGVMQMAARLNSGRLKIEWSLEDWFEEYETYHRKDGRIVKLRDDLLCATRYALMSLRYAGTRAADAAGLESAVGQADFDPLSW